MKALEPNSWYVFRVAAASDAGPSEWSHAASYCTATAPPGACPPPAALAAGFGALQVWSGTDPHSVWDDMDPPLVCAASRQGPPPAACRCCSREPHEPGHASLPIIAFAASSCNAARYVTDGDHMILQNPRHEPWRAGGMGAACGRPWRPGVQLHAGKLTRAHPRSGHVAGLAHGLQRRGRDVSGGPILSGPAPSAACNSQSALCKSQ